MKWQTTLIAALIVVVYAVIGGVIFHYLEKDNELRIQQQVNSEIADFIAVHPCIDIDDVVRVYKLMDLMFEGGLRFVNGSEIINTTRWDYQTAIFTAIELVATIGYHQAAPKSVGGRVLTICYAIIGIPLFMICIIAIGQLLNLIADLVIRLLSRCCFRKRHSSTVDQPVPPRGHWFGRRRGQVYRTVGIGVFGAILFILVPSAIFTKFEDWSYAEAVYYCFITLITIGFGDFVPGYGTPPSWLSAGWYRLAVGCWIVLLVGWFAGVVWSIYTSFYDVAERIESKVIETAEGTQPRAPPDVVVSQVGKTSVVSVVPPERKRIKKPKSSGKLAVSSGDRSVLYVKSSVPTSNNEPANNGVILDTNALAVKSTVIIG